MQNNQKESCLFCINTVDELEIHFYNNEYRRDLAFNIIGNFIMKGINHMKMKKLLAILLAVVTLLALASCTKTNNTTSTASSATASTSSSSSSDTAAASNFKWNGKKEVWSVLPTTNAVGLVSINDEMGAKLQAQGWTYSKKDAQGDPTAQVNFVETAVSSGNVGALMVAAMSVEMLQSAVQEAINAGIIVVYLGAEPTKYTINACVYTAYELTGMYAIDMVDKWAQENSPPKDSSKDNKIPVAIDVYTDIQDGQYRSNAFVNRTKESTDLYVYNTNTTYGDSAQTKAYDWAETEMTANPNLRIFVCYEPDCMVGVVQYLTQYAKDKGLDLKDFCVVNCYQDDNTTAEMAKAKADPSSTAFKGYVTYGSSLQATGDKLAEEVLGAADGSWAFGKTFYDEINANSTFDYTAHWQMGDKNEAEKYKTMSF